MTEDVPRPRSRPPWSRLSVRSRVLASVLAMSLLGVAVTGAIAFLIQDRLVRTSIDESLEQEVAEFRTLARDGRDPETGERFATTERLLRIAMLRNVPDRNETHFAYVDGQVLRGDIAVQPFDLDSEPEVVAVVGATAPDADAVFTNVTTSVGRTRLAVVPVRLAGAPDAGTYVVAYAVDRARDDLVRLARIYLAVSLASLFLVAVVGWLVAGRLLRPLTALREAAQRISEADLSERIPVTGHDDVSDLTRTYNAMLDRLQAAIETQRRFLDDAGHELRTPVTILRGHLEVMDPADPADVAATRELLVDEADRMSRMVEDLILLSKSRRPDFLLPEVVDLAAFTEQVAGKVRPLGERDWRVEVGSDARFVADGHRLTQAMVELANNAVKFSKSGSTIVVGGAASTTEIRLWVGDEGVGIPAPEVEHVFERFGRAAPGSGVAGSGLGLSIVSAIAHAHGGRVEVTSTPGAGSTFTMVLPRDEARSWPDLADAAVTAGGGFR